MKTLTGLMLLLSSTFAMADTTYKCDWYDINASEQPEGGGSHSVVVQTGGGAEVFTTPLNPNAKPYKAYDLDVYSQDGRIFTTTKIQDLSVIFTLSSDEKAGVLRIQGTMPQYGGGVSPAREYICTK